MPQDKAGRDNLRLSNTHDVGWDTGLVLLPHLLPARSQVGLLLKWPWQLQDLAWIRPIIDRLSGWRIPFLFRWEANLSWQLSLEIKGLETFASKLVKSSFAQSINFFDQFGSARNRKCWSEGFSSRVDDPRCAFQRMEEWGWVVKGRRHLLSIDLCSSLGGTWGYEE